MVETINSNQGEAFLKYLSDMNNKTHTGNKCTLTVFSLFCQYNSFSVFKWPSDEDLKGAAVGLIRLQDTYKLDSNDLASGYIDGVYHKVV